MLRTTDDGEADACRPPHDVVERAGCRPLGDPMVAEDTESEGGEHPVGGTDDEGAVRGERASVEG